jgi:hypothetical protein
MVACGRRSGWVVLSLGSLVKWTSYSPGKKKWLPETFLYRVKRLEFLLRITEGNKLLSYLRLSHSIVYLYKEEQLG